MLPELRSLRRVLPFVQPYARWLALSALCGLVVSLQQLAVPFLLKALTDTTLSGQREAFLNTVALAIAVVGVGAVATFGSRYATARYTTATIRGLRNEVTKCIQRWPIASLERTTTGDLLSRLNSDVGQVSGVLASLTDKLWRPLVFVGAVAFMLAISWQLLLAGCALIPLAAVLTTAQASQWASWARDEANRSRA